MVHPATIRLVGIFADAIGAPLDLGFVYPPREPGHASRGRWLHEGLDRGGLLRRLNEAGAENASGAAVFVRIYEADGHPGIILLDDLSAEAVSRLRAEGFDPSAVVETSANNHQAWIRLAPVGILIDRRIARGAADYLIAHFGADPRAASPVQPGRLPGFLNKKDRHRDETGRYPFVRLRSVDPLAIGHASAKLASDLTHAISVPAQAGREAGGAPETPALPAMPSDFAAVFDFLDQVRAEERVRIADETAWGRRPSTASSESEVDFAVVVRALAQEIEGASIAFWLQSRRPDKAADYANRTVNAAMSHLALKLEPRFGP